MDKVYWRRSRERCKRDIDHKGQSLNFWEMSPIVAWHYADDLYLEKDHIFTYNHQQISDVTTVNFTWVLEWRKDVRKKK